MEQSTEMTPIQQFDIIYAELLEASNKNKAAAKSASIVIAKSNGQIKRAFKKK